ncbi:hypothetical protein BpHYR1_039966, partial [Brachionus plicatilis]
MGPIKLDNHEFYNLDKEKLLKELEISINENKISSNSHIRHSIQLGMTFKEKKCKLRLENIKDGLQRTSCWNPSKVRMIMVLLIKPILIY